jgi:thiol-disulfide isomerase/thioredoxin
MDSRHLTVVIIILIAGSGLTLFVLASNPGSVSGVKVGDVAMDISLKNIDGTEFRLSTSKGKIVILDFMTTTCPYCVDEFKVLKQLDSDNRVQVISINLDITSDQDLKDFTLSNNIDWFIGTSLKAGSDYKITSVPTIIVVDKGGFIRYRSSFTTLDQFNQIINQTS